MSDQSNQFIGEEMEGIGHVGRPASPAEKFTTTPQTYQPRPFTPSGPVAPSAQTNRIGPIAESRTPGMQRHPKPNHDGRFTHEELFAVLTSNYEIYMSTPGYPDPSVFVDPDHMPWVGLRKAVSESGGISLHHIRCADCGETMNFCTHDPERTWKTAEEWQAILGTGKKGSDAPLRVLEEGE